MTYKLWSRNFIYLMYAAVPDSLLAIMRHEVGVREELYLSALFFWRSGEVVPEDAQQSGFVTWLSLLTRLSWLRAVPSLRLWIIGQLSASSICDFCLLCRQT